MSTTMMMMKGKELMLTMKMMMMMMKCVWALLVSTKSFRQIEWMTSGMPEVVFNRRTGEAVAKAKADGKSLWRISSTVFGHLASDRWVGRAAQPTSPRSPRRCCCCCRPRPRRQP